MRGSLATAIRAYVKQTYPFCSEESLYLRLPNGQLVLAEQCQKHHRQRLKRQHKKQRKA